MVEMSGKEIFYGFIDQVLDMHGILVSSVDIAELAEGLIDHETGTGGKRTG